MYTLKIDMNFYNRDIHIVTRTLNKKQITVLTGVRRTGKEIDFILHKEVCFEVKETATETDLKNLKGISRNLAIDKT